LGGKLFAHLNGAGEEAATFAIEVDEGAPIGQAEAAAQLAFGAQLRSYRFDKYKTKQKPDQKPSLETLTVMTAAANTAERPFRPLQRTAEAGVSHPELSAEPGQGDQ